MALRLLSSIHVCICIDTSFLLFESHLRLEYLLVIVVVVVYQVFCICILRQGSFPFEFNSFCISVVRHLSSVSVFIFVLWTLFNFLCTNSTDARLGLKCFILTCLFAVVLQVACAPYKASAMSAFARLLGAPANILRDCINIMKLELVSRSFVKLQDP